MLRYLLKCISLALACCTLASSARAIDFVHEVMPILKKHCVECHAGEQREGGLAMNTRTQLLAGGENGKAINLDNVAASPLLERILSDDEDLQMPRTGRVCRPNKLRS